MKGSFHGINFFYECIFFFHYSSSWNWSISLFYWIFILVYISLGFYLFIYFCEKKKTWGWILWIGLKVDGGSKVGLHLKAPTWHDYYFHKEKCRFCKIEVIREIESILMDDCMWWACRCCCKFLKKYIINTN